MTSLAAYARIISRCFVNAPLGQLDEGLLDLFLAHRLQPEIGLNDHGLDSLSRPRLEQIAKALADAGLSCTLHAPFSGIDPASDDPATLAHARERLARAFAMIPIFRPKSIVCHPHLVLDQNGESCPRRMAAAVRFWREFLPLAERLGVTVMLENTYEPSPAGHLELLGKAASPMAAAVCLDLGHIAAFARNRWQDWAVLLPLVGQLHLHDNHGQEDEHLGLGQGNIDFAGFFAHLHAQGRRPLITLEPHNEDGLVATLQTLSTLEFFAA